jgi:hypothetical protein
VSEAGNFSNLGAHGSLYYLTGVSPIVAKMINWVDVDKDFEEDGSQPNDMFKDSNGNRYNDSGVCLADSCCAATSNGFNKGSLSDTLSPILPIDIPADIPMSRENLFIAVWIPVLVSMILGVISLCCTAFQHTYDKRIPCARAPACLMASCMMCHLPCVLIFTAFLFPLMIVITDVCATGANLGSEYMLAMGSEFCEYTANGEGTVTKCLYTHDLPDKYGTNLTAELNLVGLYRGVFADDCSYSDSDPFVVLFDSLADSIRTLPLSAMEATVPHGHKEGSSSSFQLTVRPPLYNILTNTSDAAGEVISNFLKYEGREAFTCEKMSTAFSDVTDVFCIDIISSLYWYIGAWYICGFVMCCCGVPAACLTCRSSKYVSSISDTKTSLTNDDSTLSTTSNRKKHVQLALRMIPMLTSGKVEGRGNTSLGSVQIIPTAIPITNAAKLGSSRGDLESQRADAMVHQGDTMNMKSSEDSQGRNLFEHNNKYDKANNDFKSEMHDGYMEENGVMSSGVAHKESITSARGDAVRGGEEAKQQHDSPSADMYIVQGGEVQV